jgi:hypothetical protein
MCEFCSLNFVLTPPLPASILLIVRIAQQSTSQKKAAMSMGYVFVYLFLVLSAVWGGSDSAHAHDSASADGGRHNNNWAVILSSSKYWFNYRHNTNAMSIYRTVRELGIPDSQILLLLAGVCVCVCVCDIGIL